MSWRLLVLIAVCGYFVLLAALLGISLRYPLAVGAYLFVVSVSPPSAIPRAIASFHRGDPR